ncbi:MAG: Ig-like domain-containing protein [bacterium]
MQFKSSHGYKFFLDKLYNFKIKIVNQWPRKINQYKKLFSYGLVGVVLLLGVVAVLNSFKQDSKTAKAEDIVATAPVTGNYTGNLVLSPDNSLVYVRTSGYTPGGVAKYDAATNTLLGSITFENNGINLNPNGTRIYVFNGVQVKVIDTASFSVVSTIPVANIIDGFLNADGSKFYVVSHASGSQTVNTLTVIDTSSNSILTSFNTPNTVKGLYHQFSLDGSKLYLSDNARGIIIDTTSDTFVDFIPLTRDIVLSEDGKKMYSYDTATFDTIGFRVVDLATNKLDRVVFASKLVKVIPQNGKIFVIADNTLKVYDAQSYNLLSTTPIITSSNSICSSGCGIKITPDGSKLYIATMVGGSITYIGNPINNNVNIVPANNILIVMDLKSFEININSNFDYNPSIQAFSNNGKKAYIRSVGSYKVVDTTLITTSDISSFSCISPTNILGSTVTCSVTTTSPVRGLAKFTVGLESCTAYFAAAGDTTASCTYTANNVQTSPITINPSFGSSSTGSSLAITGGSGDVIISSSNIVSNNNCTPSGNVKITAIFECSFSLSGSASNIYIFPSSGIKIGVNTVVAQSNSCTLSGNGTSNAKLNCKNIPSAGGVAGNQVVLAYINGSSSGSNVGGINLTDGILVNSTTDTVDTAPGDGYCGDSNGQCTLRAAVMEANSDYFKDKITIPAGVYQLTIPPTNPSTVSSPNLGAIDGDLDVTTDIDFIGADKATTFIQAGSDATNGIDRVFQIFNTNVSFSKMTIRYGRASNSTFVEIFGNSNQTRPGNGGGIYYQRYLDFQATPENALQIVGYNDSGARNYDPSTSFTSTFNLEDVVVSDNYAQNSGGGIYDSSMQSNFNKSKIENNSSGLYGGGITKSNIYDRVVKNLFETVGEDNNSGVLNAQLSLNETNILNNKSTDGAGIYHDRGHKIFIQENTILSGNIASNNGGGVFNTECWNTPAVSTITVQGAIISSNTAVNGGGIYNECGHVETLPGNITGKNTVIEKNSASGNGAAWAGVTSSLNELTNTNILENNTQNPLFNYAGAQGKSVVWMQDGAKLNVLKSSLLRNWGRAIEFNEESIVDIKESVIYYGSGRGISYTTGTGNISLQASLNLTNTTISSNNSSGISIRANSVYVVGKHNTIVNNGFGLTLDPTTSINFDNTIISGNNGDNCRDLTASPLTSVINGSGRGKNLSDDSACNYLFGFTTNPDVQTYLGPIQDNGGVTITHALLSGNPAIDGGAGSLNYDGYPASPSIDQRGLPRPSGAGYDIGAFEGQIIPIKANPDTASTFSNSSTGLNLLNNDTGGTNGIDNNSVSVVDQPAKGSITDNGNGNFTYTPDQYQFATTGTDTFTYYFLDNIGTQSNIATVTITVNVQPSIAIDDALTTDVNSSVSLDVASNDTQGTNGISTNQVFVVDQPTKGSLSNNGYDGFTYTPDPSQYLTTGTDSFTYYFLDNIGTQSNTATVTITVNVLIPQPTANPDTSTTPESTPITIDVLANDTNATNICVGSVTLDSGSTSNATASLLTVSNVDKVLLSPTIGYYGTISFTYTACSTTVGANPSQPATVTLTVTPVNPIAVNDTATVNQNEFVTINVLANDTDPSGQTLTICSPLSTPANGAIVKQNVTVGTTTTEQIKFTPIAGFSGAASFTYTACDPAGNPSNVGTVTLTVVPNQPPVAVNDAATTLVSNPVLINLPANDTDSDGTLDLTSVTVATNPSKGIVSINTTTGIATYSPTISAFSVAGTDTFTYKIKDNDGSFSNVATVSVSVTLPPQPTATSDTVSTPESTPVTVDVLANDTNTTNICVGSIAGVTNGTAVISTVLGVDKIVFTPTIGYYGDITFTYTACSSVVGTNPSSPATATITVTKVNPIAVNDTATVNQNEFVTVNVLANDNDPSGQTLTICSPLSTPTNGSIVKTIISGREQIIFTPNPTFSGSTTFTYTACDPAGNPSNLATVNVTVTPNSAPTANPDTANTISNSPITINLPANDTDSDGSLDLTSVTIVTAPTKGNVIINPTTGIAIYTAITASFTTNQADTFTYTIKDNDAAVSNQATVTVNVVVNPVANPDIASTLSPNPVTLNIAANDTATSAALDPASVVIVTQPTKGTVTINTTPGSPDLGKATYTPNPAQYSTSSSDTFTYTIKDTENHTSNIAVATVNVTLPPANQLPIANNDTASGGKNSSITVDILANDTDPDGTISPASVVIVTGPTKGTLSINTTAASPDLGKATYTPNPAQYSTSSSDTFTYTVKDNNNGVSNTATVTLNIVLFLPTAVNDTKTLDVNTIATIDVLANDTLATSICVGSIVTTNPGATAVITNDKIVYTPANNFTGTDSLTYKACNTDGQSNNATVNITVNPLPVVPPPIIENIQLTLYKEKQDQDIIIDQPLKIQADIKNPNSIIAQKVETVINIDTTKLSFISGSAKQGSISGTKYSNVQKVLDGFSIKVEAATGVTFETMSDSQLKVTALNMQPNETLNVIFEVIPKASIQNSIKATVSIIDTSKNLVMASADAQVSLTPAVTPVFTIVRTGGLAISIGAISVIGIAAIIYLILRKRKLNIDQ